MLTISFLYAQAEKDKAVFGYREALATLILHINKLYGLLFYFNHSQTFFQPRQILVGADLHLLPTYLEEFQLEFGGVLECDQHIAMPNTALEILNTEVFQACHLELQCLAVHIHH